MRPLITDPDGEVQERVDTLLGRLHGSSPQEINSIGDELLVLTGNPVAMRYLMTRRDYIQRQLDAAQTDAAGVVARLAAACLLLYAPADEQPTPNVRFARGSGPATDIALASLYLLAHAGEVVPLNFGDGPLADATDPDFSDYRRVFGAAVDHLSTAAYYLLDPTDARAALLSSPPEQETFPPLPFPRVWIEMAHLAPLIRLCSGKDAGRYKNLDLLGIGLAEIEQGRVWDIYLPFQFDNEAEFFFLAGRIAPNAVVAIDPALGEGTLAFAAIRELGVGAAHLITTRNAPPQPVTLPRAQRRRLQASEKSVASRLYYVDLHSAGEAAASHHGGKCEYHVRWLVRGHWRHVTHGRSFCTCCDPPQIASWVAPYIKGPAGAPWKGKQVHRPTTGTT